METESVHNRHTIRCSAVRSEQQVKLLFVRERAGVGLLGEKFPPAPPQAPCTLKKAPTRGVFCSRFYRLFSFAFNFVNILFCSKVFIYFWIWIHALIIETAYVNCLQGNTAKESATHRVALSFAMLLYLFTKTQDGLKLTADKVG